MSDNRSVVEWLQEQIFNSDWKNMSGEEKLKLFEQAKAMFKEQIEDTFEDGRTWNMSWDKHSYYVEVFEKNGRYL